MQKNIVAMLMPLLFAFNLFAADSSPYPNELKDMRFYKRYLAPLLPIQSDENQVKKVLGSNQSGDLKDWKITALYSCKESATVCSHGPRNDLLTTIEIMPKHRISMSHVTFSPAFRVSYGSVSEINVTCTIYSDRFGLEYWVISQDAGSYKKDDLLWIQYGPPHP